jgi:hypothetical protein
MRIAFLGHSHHRTTGSSAFLLDLLRERAAVEEVWDEAWLTGAEVDLAQVIDGGFDAVVVWQMEDVALRLVGAGLPNVTFFPMFDGCHARPDAFWRALAPLKVVCFSSTLHEHVQRLGVRSRFVRYFPDPGRLGKAAADPGLAGYFWQRQQDVTWATVRALVGGAAFERFTVHRAVDPSYGEFVAPSAEDVRRVSIRLTDWFPTRAEAAADLAGHNVYFAPRLLEGIGMAFLEAMAMGFLVVGANRPTMNEYIVSGVNGLLFDPSDPQPLDFSAHAVLGARARRTVESGWRAWCRARPALVDFVLTPAAACPVLAPLDAFDPAAAGAASAAGTPGRRVGSVPTGGTERRSATARVEGGRRLQSGARGGDGHAPIVTVALVTRDAEPLAAATLDSALRQEGLPVEILVLDRASRDGTVDLLRRMDGDLDHWVSEQDRGPGAALNAAVRHASGRYLVVLRPGDAFRGTDALSAALADAPGDADLVIGHHVRRRASGHEALRQAADLDETLARLLDGDVDARWHAGIPAHAATLVRTELLRREPYRTDLGLTAHEEVLFRLATRGARSHHSMSVVATVLASSRRAEARSIDESRGVALAYTKRPALVARGFAEIREEAWRADLPFLTVPELLRSLARVRARKELARRLREELGLAASR